MLILQSLLLGPWPPMFSEGWGIAREVSHYPRHKKTNSTNTAVDFLELPFRPLDGCWCLESIHHLLLGCPSSFGGWCGYDVMTTLARKNEYCDKRNTLNSRATHFETYPNDVFQDILNMEFFECQTLRMSERWKHHLVPHIRIYLSECWCSFCWKPTPLKSTKKHIKLASNFVLLLFK